MTKTIGIGHQNFEEIITEDIFYIDKTMFIKEWWENKDAVTLITCPRRFGKTLNLSMLNSFFSVSYPRRTSRDSYSIKDSDKSRLFHKLSIWNYEFAFEGKKVLIG